jgi:hypothetical protein
MVLSGLLAQRILSLCLYHTRIFHMRLTLFLKDISNTPLETSVQTYDFRWRNIPQDSNFYSHLREDFKTEVIIYHIVFKE